MHSHSISDRANYWQHHIDSWHDSDLSGATYCQSQGLVYHQFLYWRRKLGKSPVPSAVTSGGFSQVRLAPREDATGLHVRLPDGVEIHGIDTVNLAVVRQLLSGL